jgi:hypothetical protein
VSAESLDDLRLRGEAFTEAVSREMYLAHAGLKATADLQTIYRAHASVLSDESLGVATDAFRSAPAGSEQHRQSRLLLDWQAESRVSRELAALDEREIAWESGATIVLADGGSIPYQRAAIDIANAEDRATRLAIDEARGRLVEAELAPLRREHFQREREITEQLGLAADYNQTFEVLSGISLGDLRAECEGFLRDTEAMWDEVYPGFVRRGLGIPPGDATRADAVALMRAREFDAYFPQRDLQSQVVRQVTEMGLSPDAHGRVRIDTEDRPTKHSRAFCAPVRVPEEVYLVLRPHGGQSDWNTFLHELGHALHFGNMRASLPFEYRWLGDNSLTEAYAMLFDHLMQDGGWLERYSSLGATRTPGFLRVAGFEELHMLRRYCAKLIYEVQLYAGGAAWSRLPELYAELLSSATTFRYERGDAFVDVDARYYSARYLRAWQLQALLAEALVDQFDADWWRNPRAGPWVVEELFAPGQRELADEQAARISGRPLSFYPLVRRVEQLLG